MKFLTSFVSSEISRDRRMLSEILWNKIVRSKQRNDEERNKKKKNNKIDTKFRKFPDNRTKNLT